MSLKRRLTGFLTFSILYVDAPAEHDFITANYELMPGSISDDDSDNEEHRYYSFIEIRDVFCPKYSVEKVVPNA